MLGRAVGIIPRFQFELASCAGGHTPERARRRADDDRLGRGGLHAQRHARPRGGRGVARSMARMRS